MAGVNETTKGGGFKLASLIVLGKRYLGAGGAGGVRTLVEFTKAVTGLTDTTATTVFTVTVPNVKHAAVIEVDAVGVMGAGGAVGAGETVKSSKYYLVVNRTAGLAAVVTVSAAIVTTQSKVAGADNITSTVVTATAMTGANSATQTFSIQVAITKAAGAADNHTCFTLARLLNGNASGITIV